MFIFLKFLPLYLKNRKQEQKRKGGIKKSLMISIPISKYANNALVFKSELLKKLKVDAFVTSKNNLDLLVVDMCIFTQGVAGKLKSTVIVWLPLSIIVSLDDHLEIILIYKRLQS